LLGAFLPLILQRLYDKKRVETVLCLGWESLHAVIVDPHLRSLTIIFRPIVVAKVDEKPFHGLSLARLSPTTVAGIETTLRHFAPDAIYVKRQSVNSARTLLIILCATTAVGLVCIFVVFYFSRFGTP